MTTSDNLLKILEENRGSFVSGAVIAQDLGITGTAVWKASRKLRREGYMIEAVTNRGYRLLDDADLLSTAEMQRYYKSFAARDDNSALPHIPLSVEIFDMVESTNSICAERALHGMKETYVAVASGQTKGRGRLGRSFYSPDKTGLYLSILVRPHNMRPEESLKFTSVAAAATARAIEDLTGKDVGIKWVNDIYMNHRKVCGILTEASFDLDSKSLDYAIVGIGINVYEPHGGFPAEIKGKAGAICARGERISRSMLAALILYNFLRYYKQETAQAGSSDYRMTNAGSW